MSPTKIFLSFLLIALHVDGRSFRIDYDRNTFLLDGEPFRYVSGSMHYFRIHPDLWSDRLEKLRAAGFNAVEVYVDWSLHEPHPGEYDFDGQADVVKFLKIAHGHGLYVILRPGPYIDGERDLGGLPAWLLKDKPLRIRTSDKAYVQRVDLWFGHLLPRLKDLLVGNGGPIIMVQVENEYGSYGLQTGNCDKAYMTHVRDLIVGHLGNDTVLFANDGPSEQMLNCSKIPGVYQTVDFGPGDRYEQYFDVLRKFEPRGPLVNSEFYPGWFDRWSEPHKTVGARGVADTVDKLLAMDANVNLYMAHGGTNFGFRDGANSQPNGTEYIPVVTSYDYNAPISEAGDLTDKYFILKEVITRYLPDPKLPVKNSTKAPFGPIQMTPISTLFGALDYLSSRTISSRLPLSFEDIGQNYGFVVYETTLKEKYLNPARLEVTSGIRDRAHVFVNEQFQGLLSRMTGVSQVGILAERGDRLRILVENQGRVRYGAFTNYDRKGVIDGAVTMNGDQLLDWQMYALDLETSQRVLKFARSFKSRESRSVSTDDTKCSFWKGTFAVSDPADTFLDFGGNWSKGVAFVNGVNVGRYWPDAGPQVTLYVPAPMLTTGENTIILLELDGVKCDPPTTCSVTSVASPVLDGPTPHS